MQIVSSVLDETSKSIIWEKEEKIYSKILSAEIFTQHAKHKNFLPAMKASCPLC